MESIENTIKALFYPFDREYDISKSWMDKYVIKYLEKRNCRLKLPDDYDEVISKIDKYHTSSYALFQDDEENNIFLSKKEECYEIIDSLSTLEINNKDKSIILDYRIESGKIMVESSFYDTEERTVISYWSNELLDEKKKQIYPERIAILSEADEKELYESCYDINIILSHLRMKEFIKKDKEKVLSKLFKRKNRNV